MDNKALLLRVGRVGRMPTVCTKAQDLDRVPDIQPLQGVNTRSWQSGITHATKLKIDFPMTPLS